MATKIKKTKRGASGEQEIEVTRRGRRKGRIDPAGFGSDELAVIKSKMDAFALEHYLRYGNAVLEDRAIPDYRDGQNPVNRRILWAAHTLGINSKAKVVKAARIIGDVVGRFHPHGDVSCYKAMVGMTNVGKFVNNIAIGLIEGSGSWGNLSSRQAAAMRYTEARLSKFSDEVLFNKFYLPVMETVPNYDGSTVEPLVLPALLPLVFLNGRFGIAPGATTNIPSFEGNSVLKMLKAAYSGEELTPKFLAKTLKVISTFGGVETGVNDEHRKALFKGKKGAVVLQSQYRIDDKKHTITFDRFAIESLPKAIDKLMTFEGVARVEDLSNVKDRYGCLVVHLKKQMENKTKKVKEKVIAAMTVRENFILNFTRRYKNEIGQDEAKMKAMELPKVLPLWVKWRIGLERKACAYWINEDEKTLYKLGLLIQAVDMIDFIVKILKDKKLKNNDEVFKAYATKAKVSVDDAKYVLGRPIISLRNMQKIELEAEVKSVKANKKKLEQRRDKPLPHLIEQLETFKPFFKES